MVPVVRQLVPGLDKVLVVRQLVPDQGMVPAVMVLLGQDRVLEDQELSDHQEDLPGWDKGFLVEVLLGQDRALEDLKRGTRAKDENKKIIAKTC